MLNRLNKKLGSNSHVLTLNAEFNNECICYMMKLMLLVFVKEVLLVLKIFAQHKHDLLIC